MVRIRSRRSARVCPRRFIPGETRRVNSNIRPTLASRRPKPRALTLVAFILLAGVLRAQTPPPEAKDPLGRNTPQEAVFQFLETCHARDYTKAAHYLDLRRMPAAERAKQGPALAAQLEDLLDDTPFDISDFSRDPEGDNSDGLSATRERLDTFRVGGQTLELQLERVELRPGYHVWLVVPLGESEAHEAGRLLGVTRTADIVDAVVVTTALRRKATILTSDPDDIERLVRASGRNVAVVAI